MYKQSLAVLFAAAILSPSALADKHINDHIVVTATRAAQSIDETLAPVTLIDRAQIELQQPKDVLDLLTTAPGIEVTRSGGRGATADIFMRGASTKHVLVLVDGVRLESATLGSASLQYLDPAQIERIEIVRGPRSSLYGSDAIGGVIQIFTRKTDNQFRPVVKLGFGDIEY